MVSGLGYLMASGVPCLMVPFYLSLFLLFGSKGSFFESCKGSLKGSFTRSVSDA